MIQYIAFEHYTFIALDDIDTKSVVQFSESVNREAVLEMKDHIYIDPVSRLVYSKTETEPSNVSVWSVLPKDKCEQFTTTYLGVELLNKTKVDYTTVSLENYHAI